MPAELRAMAAAAAASGASGGGGRWAEVAVGRLLVPAAFGGRYAAVETRCYAHDGTWKRGLDFDCVYLRPVAA